MKEEKIKLLNICTVPWQLWFFFENQFSYMKSKGFDIHGACSPGDMVENIRKREGIEIHEIQINKYISPISDIISLIRIMKLLIKIKPHIVHSHTPKAGFLAMIAAYLLRIPARFHTLHGMVVNRISLKGVKRFAVMLTEKITCCLANKVFCVSKYTCNEAVKRRYAKEEKFLILHHGSANGIDAENRFNPENENIRSREEVLTELGIPNDAVVIGFVGRVVKEKGIVELAMAWDRIKKEFNNAYLLIIGPTEKEEPLPDNILDALKKDDRARLIGMVSDIVEYNNAMDIFVLPSHREGLSTAILEAFAMSKPVIASNVPGCLDLIDDGITGKLVPTHDVEALWVAMRFLMKDRATREKMGAAAREYVCEFFKPIDIWSKLALQYKIQLKKNHKC